ncbi:MAG: cold shock domain-containing protein [Ignavibacteriaceae bacterium]|nr:cold shock domain-containing protein [Ignavibacteriaceae bacterium]
MSEPLDFCRVKKIDEKGFGFLKSLNYPGDIFFHFSQIRKEDFREKLNHMKRGDFIIYFISKLQPNGKRKADKIWYLLSDVPAELIPGFAERIIGEFSMGTINLYDLLYAFDELKKGSHLSREQIDAVLSSQKVKNLPTTILPYISREEYQRFLEILDIKALEGKEPKPFWYEDVLKHEF